MRSQNKMVLFKCDTINIEPFRGQFVVYSRQYGNLGKYDTEERCLEILDEIQSLIVSCLGQSATVYQMPEK